MSVPAHKLDLLLNGIGRLAARMDRIETAEHIKHHNPEVAALERRLQNTKRELALQAQAVMSGQIVESITTDRSGRPISKFYGDPALVWAPFKHPGRKIKGWNSK